eukprot:TRINITY_DN3063_c0_g1_i1.p1 TRINITY_DN3063_c0_g1~~TRINITY_DN3063_c0_g1_i1.p1  ORF type:complete len:148 (+),score=55.71 TRINITY_DN3063_c0_g1_i1:372-815(+)
MMDSTEPVVLKDTINSFKILRQNIIDRLEASVSLREQLEEERTQIRSTDSNGATQSEQTSSSDVHTTLMNPNVISIRNRAQAIKLLDAKIAATDASVNLESFKFGVVEDKLIKLGNQGDIDEEMTKEGDSMESFLFDLNSKEEVVDL